MANRSRNRRKNSYDDYEDQYDAVHSSRKKQSNDYSSVDEGKELIHSISKGISQLSQITRSIDQKVSLFNTPQDSRSNHDKVNEYVEKGKNLTNLLKKKIETLNNLNIRSLSAQVKKLTNDFRSQLQAYDISCKKLIRSEQESVDFIRRSSIPRQRKDKNKYRGRNSSIEDNNNENNHNFDYSNFDEDQLYASANVVTYDEDDLNRREEDIIHINTQLKEVNAAYREIDELVNDQEEVVIEMTENTQVANERVEAALDQVQKADKKAKYCNCSKRKCCCTIIGVIILVTIVFFTVSQFK